MTYPPEKLCIRWQDFQQNIVSSCKDLQKSSDFSDVTLVCEEDQTIEAHRIVLASCSPFFSRVLKGNKHSHPMIYMRGLKEQDLVAIVDFIYSGETNIYEDDLDEFLALAEELQLKGLAGYKDLTKDSEKKIDSKSNNQRPPKIKQESSYEFTNLKESFATESLVSPVPVETKKVIVSADISTEDLKAKIDSMMERVDYGEYKWKCIVCGKASIKKAHTTAHIEIHIKGLSYPCNQCGKVSRSSGALASHISAFHRK